MKKLWERAPSFLNREPLVQMHRLLWCEVRLTGMVRLEVTPTCPSRGVSSHLPPAPSSHGTMDALGASRGEGTPETP
jgi:hypothetical protein